MKYKVIKSSQVSENDLGSIYVKELLSEADIPNMSLAIVKIDGTNKKIVHKVSDALYFVLEGSGHFNIDGEEIRVEKGDTVYIPKGCAYYDSGQMTLLSYNNPRYEVANVSFSD